MPSDGKTGQPENLKDKLRTFFGSQNLQKNKPGLPPKAHFSIWYCLMVFLLFSYLQQYYFPREVETISYR